MQPERDLAIILKTVIYEERHRIVTALTENHGVISALARNSIQSRRFGGTLEPFTASEWLFAQKPGADLARLEEASIRRSFEGLRADFERLSIASVMNEMMLRTAPRYEPCPDFSGCTPTPWRGSRTKWGRSEPPRRRPRSARLPRRARFPGRICLY